MFTVQPEPRGAPGSPAPVVSLHVRRAAGAEARAQRTLNHLAHEAIVALEAVLAGDVDAIHGAFWAISRAVRIVLDHRMATAWTKWRAGA